MRVHLINLNNRDLKEEFRSLVKRNIKNSYLPIIGGIVIPLCVDLRNEKPIYFMDIPKRKSKYCCLLDENTII